MTIKVDKVLHFLKSYSDSGTRWGDIPLTMQIEATWILYNENKKHYDKRSSMSNNGIINTVSEDLYTQYEFLEGTVIATYDNKEAPMGEEL